MKRVHAPRGKLNVEVKQETVISSRGMSNVEVTIMLGCGSFVRGRKRKKGDSIPFILSRRDYMRGYPMRLHGEVTW